MLKRSYRRAVRNGRLEDMTNQELLLAGFTTDLLKRTLPLMEREDCATTVFAVGASEPEYREEIGGLLQWTEMKERNRKMELAPVLPKEAHSRLQDRMHAPSTLGQATALVLFIDCNARAHNRLLRELTGQDSA